MQNKYILNLKEIQRHLSWCLCIVVALLATGCDKGEKVPFHRLEQLLFETPVDQLTSELNKHHAEYDSELLRLAPGNAGFDSMLRGYVCDPTIRLIYQTTDSLYHDMSVEEHQLGKALAKAYKLLPSMQRVERVCTMVTADYDNYDFRTISNKSDLCIAIDNYALEAGGLGQRFGVPQYIVRTCTREQIVPDCMRTLAKQYIAWPEQRQTLLDYAIAEGKVIYFVEQTMPKLADSTLLRYTGEQLQWMRQNEQNVWGWILQNKLLYSTDIGQTRNLIVDAPHTNNFGNESAPRTATYIGWQIVKAYMHKSGATMQELFEELDSQQILRTSGWRPST